MSKKLNELIRRRQDVATMNASFALSGFTPDEQDLENQRRYILGELTLDDLLAHAQAFARAQGPVAINEQERSLKKVVIVTGSGRGIGAAVARQLAAQGHAVAVNFRSDRDAADELIRTIRADGGLALAVQADVADEAQVAQMFALVEQELGPISALVNNAGITSRMASFMQTAPATIEDVFRTNVYGTMYCCRAAIESFRKSGTKGVIVNVSSVAAATGSPNEYVHYAASKAAVETFTLGLAKELAAEGIRVCAVAPGLTLTDIHTVSGEPDRPARLAPKIPMQRPATPEEIAEPIVWLLSPAASYITGTTLRCGGGL